MIGKNGYLDFEIGHGGPQSFTESHRDLLPANKILCGPQHLCGPLWPILSKEILTINQTLTEGACYINNNFGL